jgi:hypothetical protein
LVFDVKATHRPSLDKAACVLSSPTTPLVVFWNLEISVVVPAIVSRTYTSFEPFVSLSAGLFSPVVKATKRPVPEIAGCEAPDGSCELGFASETRWRSPDPNGGEASVLDATTTMVAKDRSAITSAARAVFQSRLRERSTLLS